MTVENIEDSEDINEHIAYHEGMLDYYTQLFDSSRKIMMRYEDSVSSDGAGFANRPLEANIYDQGNKNDSIKNRQHSIYYTIHTDKYMALMDFHRRMVSWQKKFISGTLK